MLPNITQRQQPNLKDQNILRTQNQLHWNLHRKASPSVESSTRSRHQRSGRTEVSDSPWWQCAGWAAGTRASTDIRNVAHFDLALNGAHRESTTVNRRSPSPASSPPSSASPSRRASRAGPPSGRLPRRRPVELDSLHLRPSSLCLHRRPLEGAMHTPSTSTHSLASTPMAPPLSPNHTASLSLSLASFPRVRISFPRSTKLNILVDEFFGLSWLNIFF